MKVSDQIRVHLEEAISRGTLLPGDAIDEAELAERFGVSRTPVREALIQLQAQGWVGNLPRGGPIVAKMNLQQLLSLWELLAELEGVAIRLACERMSDDEIAQLVTLHEGSREVVEREDLTRWQALNLQFHEQVYRGSRNPYLRQEVLRIRFRTGVYRRHAFGALGHLNASFEQHQALVDALRNRDAEGAAARMRDHMRPGRDARTLNDFVVNLPADLLAPT
ncbi:MAG: GntR family transcriptional regulator [Ramlibacter sp.]